MPAPHMPDTGRDGPNILAELARVRCLFQLRTIAAVIGAPAPRFEGLPDAGEGDRHGRPAMFVPFHAAGDRP